MNINQHLLHIVANKNQRLLLTAESSAIDSYCKALELKTNLNELTKCVDDGTNQIFDDIQNKLQVFESALAQFKNAAEDLLNTIRSVNVNSIK